MSAAIVGDNTAESSYSPLAIKDDDRLLSATATSAPAIQSGTTTIAAGSVSATATIADVDLSKTFLTFSVSVNSAVPQAAQISGQITNSTTLNFQRWSGNGSPAASIKWYVVTYPSGVAVQRGSIAMNVTTRTENVALPSSVDLSKSFPLISYRVTGYTFDASDFVKAKLTTGTNLELTVNRVSVSPNMVEWQVVQFTNSVVQSGEVSFAAGAASSTATMSGVDPSRSWLMYTYKSDSGTVTNIGQKLVRGLITNGNSLIFDRANTGQALQLTWYAVQFNDGTTVQHGTQAFTASDAQKNVTISRVDTSKSIAVGGYHLRGGKSTYSADDNPGVGWFKLDLTSGTNLQIIRALTGSATADIGWTVIQFPGSAGAGASPTPTPAWTPTPTPTQPAIVTPTSTGTPTPSPTATAAATLVPSPGFVTANGRSLYLKGLPYTFVGVNRYNLITINPPGPAYQGCGGAWSEAELASWFTEISNQGVNAVRFWAFQRFTANGTDFARMDYVLSLAGQHNIKVIPTFENQWQDCTEGGYKRDTWYASGYLFPYGSYTMSFRDYVGAFVNRYKSDERILMWQLMNEAEIKAVSGQCGNPQTLKNFAADVSAYIKSIDNNHLVNIGTMGGGQCGAQGSQYQTLHDIPTVDLCEYHDYNSPSAPMPGSQYNGLQMRFNQCAALNKPLFIGEAGIKSNCSDPDCHTPQQRADFFNAKMAAFYGAGGVGYAIWSYRERDGVDPPWEYDAGDPLAQITGRY